MNKQETKQTLLQIGNQLMAQHGYNNTGLNEILEAASIPKGSFYYYFNSKEDFALQVLEQFFARIKAKRIEYLENETLDPLARLRAYYDWYAGYLEAAGCRFGCLMGTLGQELADQNEVFRARIDTLMMLSAEELVTCLSAAQQSGQINASLDMQELAAFCFNSWQGAMLRMKVTKTPAPLHTFIHILFDVILKQ